VRGQCTSGTLLHTCSRSLFFFAVVAVCTMHCNDPPFPLPLVVSTVVASVGIFAHIVALLKEEEQRELEEALLAHSLALLQESRKRRARALGDSPRQKSYVVWDRDRAHQYIAEDYLGNVPGFKGVFHVSHQKYDEIHNILCNSDPFFRDTMDARNHRSISIDAKILRIYLIWHSNQCI
jgi:hypothetical protein